MPYNLINDPWIQVYHENGVKKYITPYQIVDTNVKDFSIPRPDFYGAMLEFAIALIQTCAPPKSRKEWRTMQEEMTVEELKNKLEPFTEYFNFLGQRPLFQQDLTLSPKEAGDSCPINSLLIDQPAGNTLKNNADFFIRRGSIKQLCPSCAALALQTLQTYAPSGGVGHRTSLRGGGPLTTLIDDSSFTLWQKIMSNVQPLDRRSSLGTDDFEPTQVFPWLSPTLESNSKTGIVFPEDRHPLEAFWAMPRRIVLISEELGSPVSCDICAASTCTVVRHYYAKNYGNNYHDTWRHPLSPYRSQGPGKVSLPIKGMADGTAYSNWLGIVYGDGGEQKSIESANCLQRYKDITHKQPASVHAFGYAMDNAKALMWCEGRYPVFSVQEDDLKEFRSLVTRLVSTADKSRMNLIGALKKALFTDEGRNAKATQSLLSNVSKQFWNNTEADFYITVEQCSYLLADKKKLEPLLANWLNTLLQAVLTLFDNIAEAEKIENDPRKLRQVCQARGELQKFTIGFCRKTLDILKKEAA